jgi:hydrogenase maturation factor
MCIELPGTVVALDGDLARVRYRDRTVSASTLVVPDVAVGDPVVVLAGTIVARLTPAEEAEIAAALERAADGGPR